MKGVYLLHFEPRYKHAGHYLGYAEDIERRVDEHRRGAERNAKAPRRRAESIGRKSGTNLFSVRKD